MWSSDSDRDEQHVETATTAASSPAQQQPSTPPAPPRRRRQRARRRAQRLRAKNTGAGAEPVEEEEEAEAEDVWRVLQQQRVREREAWPRRASRPVVVAAGEEGSPADAASGESGSGGMGRARSLTDDDLEELKGCVDLGFGFSYHEIPELCGTLPALELCYSMSQRFLDEHQQLGSKAEEAPAVVVAPASPAQPVATNWKISSPGAPLSSTSTDNESTTQTGSQEQEARKGKRRRDRGRRRRRCLSRHADSSGHGKVSLDRLAWKQLASCDVGLGHCGVGALFWTEWVHKG